MDPKPAPGAVHQYLNADQNVAIWCLQHFARHEEATAWVRRIISGLLSAVHREILRGLEPSRQPILILIAAVRHSVLQGTFAFHEKVTECVVEVPPELSPGGGR